ncbi:MAG: tRNA (N6-isopentenyl adenosine(37)-C2)-methylthiotransferase MiaB [candidate division Zixibacteria bacterium]|nr:tRNA (N6-isopentenyl adenosine(37)-C2)-methylthiotransferase MiaB [candidate division Zixibacteria bacterium]
MTQARPETFHISTYGCQMNLADSSTLASALITRGYRRVEHEQDADLIILNTCSVREKAEERVLGRLGELYQHKRRKPSVKIAVVGCMAQRLSQDLRERVPHVDMVLGTDRLFELPDVLEGNEGTQAVMTAFGHEDIDMILPVKETPYSAFLTISRGCDNYCTYCIVPYVRGKERSHSAEYLVDSVRKLVDEGVVEITLLGQNVNSYRHGDTDFPGLLQRVIRETGVKRLRFMTSHPKDLSRKLVDVLADEPRLLPHVHLPLQSGSNRILKMMGRIYTIEHYFKIVDYIREKLPYFSLTTDLIVGFPTETDEEYEMTLAAVHRIRYDSAFMFRYSVRPGTTAAKLPDDVPEDVKIARLNRLIRLQQEISYEVNQREIGQIRTSLVEGDSRRSKEYRRARTEGNKTVLFRGDHAPVGSILPIRITAADAFTLHGEIAENG